MPLQELGPLGEYEANLELSASYEIGILRLYRSRHVYPEPQCLESNYPEQIAGSSAATTSNAAKSCVGATEERPRTLAVLAVPGYMTPADFLTFTASFRDGIEHVRVIRDGSPNHYMMLLQFRSVAVADEFYAYYNGKTFSPLEPETCHVVYVYEVRCEVHEINSATDIDKKSQTVRAELPTCPVCLERLDNVVSGLLTTLCQHLFHCRCLAQWGSGNCPVCRYSQISTFVDQERFQRTISERSNCHICGRTSDLWICLICGVIGCGRYANGHAKDHFEQTQHPYSMELNSQNVWDYAGDGYVHRLLQSAADHKVIAVDIGQEAINGTATSTAAASEQRPTEVLPRQGSLFDAHEKLDAVTTEYEMLLASQLESQREQYEVQLARVRHQQAQQMRKYTELERQYSQEREKYRELEKQQAKYDCQQQASLEKQLARRLEESVNKWVKKSTEDAKLLMEERALTRQLSENQDDLKGQIAQLKATLADVREEVRDLTFFISTQKSLAQEQHGESEIHGASIVGVSEPAASSARRGRGKGKRRLRK
ncbi:BRCA1-associated protein 2-domain-containing protein [Coemansia mojavensis]|nr:BRCA1-associated protein 2-domain-containing protein [Coemansia mojavensis]